MLVDSLSPSLNNTPPLVNEKSKLRKTLDIIAKVSLVALMTLSGAALGAGIALSFLLDVVILSAVGGGLGLITSIFILIKLGKNKQQVHSSQPSIGGASTEASKSFTYLNQEIITNFAKKNEAKIANLVQIIDEKGKQKTPLSNEELDQILEVARETEINIYNLNKLEELRNKMDLRAFEIIVVRFAPELCAGRINAEMEQLILNAAKVAESEIKLDDLFDKIKLAARQDLYLNDKHIEDHFQVEAKLQELPDDIRQQKRDRLQLIINQAYVNREMNNKGKITTGDKNEVLVLDSFNCFKEDKSSYFDKDALYTVFKQIMEEQISEENYKLPLKQVQDFIHACALRNRLKTVGITSEFQIEKFQISHRFVKCMRKKIKKELHQFPLVLPEGFPLNEESLNVKQLRKIHLGEGKKAVLELLREGLNGFMLDSFRDDEKSLPLYKKRLGGLPEVLDEIFKEVMENRKESAYITALVEFLSKWGGFLKAELIQGADDADEILGDGVCWGISQRLRLKAQQTDISLQDFIQQMKIQSEDRYLQGVHSLAVTHGLGGKLPENRLKHEQYEQEEEVFVIVEPSATRKNKNKQQIVRENLLNNFKEASKSSGASKGWISLSFAMEEDGHMTLMRLDQEANKVWFFDPNIGLVAFEEGRSFDEGLELCADFMIDLIKLYYSDTWALRSRRLVAGQKRKFKSRLSINEIGESVFLTAHSLISHKFKF